MTGRKDFCVAVSTTNLRTMVKNQIEQIMTQQTVGVGACNMKWLFAWRSLFAWRYCTLPRLTSLEMVVSKPA